ncbi:helix-turn-helix transcriptional regulator [Paenibacillus septentrionalis]|uniref:Helix-turn-helix transcriptional regulator n=1 Tax=Paenibacillus septentrionalis TaxID=429342 RepID=A0ABW1V6V7_9BACL
MLVGQKLKEQRLKQNETQESVANKLGVSRQTISNWENGKTLPDIDSLIKLSQIYQLSIDELFDVTVSSTVEATHEESATATIGSSSSKVLQMTLKRNAKLLSILLLLVIVDVRSVFLFVLLLISLLIKYIMTDFSQLKT